MKRITTPIGLLLLAGCLSKPAVSPSTPSQVGQLAKPTAYLKLASDTGAAPLLLSVEMRDAGLVTNDYGLVYSPGVGYSIRGYQGQHVDADHAGFYTGWRGYFTNGIQVDQPQFLVSFPGDLYQAPTLINTQGYNFLSITGRIAAITFNTVSNGVYQLQWAPTSGGPWVNMGDVHFIGSGEPITDFDDGNQPMRLYRVQQILQ